MKHNILHITPDFNYACGRSYYVFLLLKYLKLNGHKVYLISNKGDSFDRINDNDIPFFIIKSLMHKNPISFTKTISVLKNIIQENNIDIIHTHHRYCEFEAVQVSKYLKKKEIKTIFTSLSLVKNKYCIEYKSDKIIAVSETIKRMLTKRFEIENSRIELIPNFVDSGELEHFSESKPLKNDEKKYYRILSIGRFHPDKNFEILLKALNILKDKHIQLTLIGEGEKFKDYQKYIKKNHLRVQILPPQKNLYKYFNHADLCILPSIRDPFPNFMLQSGLFKKPFIGSNLDGIAEFIINGKNGLVFEKNDAQELANKIKIFKENKTFASDCAINLHKIVLKNYTQRNVIPKIEKLYQRVLID